jgi:hypothetical protein
MQREDNGIEKESLVKYIFFSNALHQKIRCAPYFSRSIYEVLPKSYGNLTIKKKVNYPNS